MGRPRNHIFATELTKNWDAVLHRVGNRHARSQLHRLADYCSAMNVAPDKVTANTLHWFVEALATHRVARPHQVLRDVVKTWNALASAEGWRVEPLATPESRRPAGLGPGDLPQSFQDDVEAFLGQVGGTDLFDETTRKPLSAPTRLDRRRKIYQLAHRLIASGEVTEVTRLSDLVEPRAYRAILEPLWQKGPSGNAYNLARLMTQIARFWAKCTPDEVARLKNAENRLRPGKRGMTPKNDLRIRHFENPENVRRLLRLPSQVVKRLDRSRPTVMDAVAVQSALAIAILLRAPIRERNLASIDIVKHVHRVGPTQCHLVFAEDEVKNREALDMPLSARTIELLDLYVQVYRPLLAKHGGTALFVSFNGRQKAPHELGAQIAKFIKEETGLTLNAHAFRHLAGFVYLKAHPGEYETVRRLLGHKSQQTTVDFYLGAEKQEVFRQHNRVLDRYLLEDDHAA